MAPMIMVVMLLLILQHLDVNQIAALRFNHPQHDVVEKINRRGGTYIGLVMAYPGEEVVLQASGLFVPNSDFPLVLLSGRRFNVGTISGVDVIYVMTGEKKVNGGVTVQILLDAFDVIGVVHYGIAGSTNDSLLIGDVSIMNYVAFTDSWNWQELELQQCLNETYCLTNKPKVAFGLRGATADVFLKNGAYRNYLFKEFNISTTDEESAAVVMTALSNKVPCIVFRGVSDMAGAGAGASKQSTTLSWSSVAAVNALRMAVAFIELFGKGDPRIDLL